MGIFDLIKNRGQTIDDAVGEGEVANDDASGEGEVVNDDAVGEGEVTNDEGHDENHEPGTPRGEKRACYHIDPVTKQPMHPEGD